MSEARMPALGKICHEVTCLGAQIVARARLDQAGAAGTANDEGIDGKHECLAESSIQMALALLGADTAHHLVCPRQGAVAHRGDDDIADATMIDGRDLGLRGAGHGWTFIASWARGEVGGGESCANCA